MPKQSDWELELYGRAEEVSDFNASTMIAMSLLAHEFIDNPRGLEILTDRFGRKAIYLARAVERHKDYFDEEFTMETKPLPDHILSLWYMAQLGKAKDEELFEEWRDNTLTSWQVREKVAVLKKRRRKKINAGEVDNGKEVPDVELPKAQVTYNRVQREFIVNAGNIDKPVGELTGEFRVALWRLQNVSEIEDSGE